MGPVARPVPLPAVGSSPDSEPRLENERFTAPKSLLRGKVAATFVGGGVGRTGGAVTGLTHWKGGGGEPG